MKLLVTFLVVLFLVGSTAIAKEVGGKNLPDNLKISNSTIILNGAGVIKKFFFKVYAIGLYLPDKSTNAKSIIAADKPMAIIMHFIRNDIEVKKILDAYDEGFQKATNMKTGPIQSQINKFKAFFTQTIYEDNVYQFDYEPGVGTKVYINKQFKGTIEGLDFKKALFGIWLGEDPRDSGVKEDMLGL